MTGVVIPIRPAPPADHFDRIDRLWNTSALNPAVQARQRQAIERTRMLLENSPQYAAELVNLQDLISDYDISLPEGLRDGDH